MSSSEVQFDSSKTIDLFDFDHTIYDGDASLDFFIYSIRKHPTLLRYLPIQLWNAFLYLASINSRKQFKESFFIFLRSLKDVDQEVADFWIVNKYKIKPWYINRTHRQDVIISASPHFLLMPKASELGVKSLIATRMDKSSGKIAGKNCRGREKAARLKEELPGLGVSQAYSDSMADAPILSLAKEAYIVKKNEIIARGEFRQSRIKKHFFKKSFLSFVFVGGLNAIVGLSFAFTASIFIDNKTVAFMVGYSLGLIPSYFLNSTITFHNTDYNLKAFIKYCISYIPNFLIQTLCVGLLIEVLHLNKGVSYVIAVAVGVPVTFLIVSILAIKEKEME